MDAIDAHCHPGAPRAGMRFVCAAAAADWPAVAEAEEGGDFAFFGIHPFNAAGVDPAGAKSALLDALERHPRAGVGEIGLDRLRDRSAVPLQRALFEAQLEAAAEARRAVALHGAKAWGETFKTARRFAGAVPVFLFHGFSRSGGLVRDIAAIGGYFGVGAAVLNEHAVNYRELVRALPRERILAETDGPRAGGAPEHSIGEIVRGIASVLGIDAEEAQRILDANARAFMAAARPG